MPFARRRFSTANKYSEKIENEFAYVDHSFSFCDFVDNPDSHIAPNLIGFKLVIYWISKYLQQNNERAELAHQLDDLQGNKYYCESQRFHGWI